MQRDIVLSLTLLVCLYLTIRQPFAGILSWTWLTVMQPHKEAFGIISSTLRLNLIVAILTIGVWLFSKDRKLPLVDSTLVVILLFMTWMTINCILAVNPSVSWDA